MFRPSSKRWLLAGLMIATAAGIGMLVLFDPASCRVFPPCPFHALTGLHCPGCGSLRALHQLLQGHIKEAFALNALMVVFLPFVVYGLAAQGLFYFFNKKIPTVFMKPAWIWAIFAIIILYGIARNIPVYPFTVLAP